MCLSESLSIGEDAGFICKSFVDERQQKTQDAEFCMSRAIFANILISMLHNTVQNSK